MIKPLPGYVLIEPIEDELKTGDVYRTEASKDKPSKGKVVATGLANKKEYHSIVDNFQDGDVVIYKKWTNQEVEHEGKKYLLVKFDELLGVIE